MKTTLFRPIGVGEYRLIKDSGYKKFPPRLDWQPIFYPVLNEVYAQQIAERWNTEDEFSGYCGLVTSFDLSAEYLEKFEVQNVGGEIYEELWVLAEELSEFNDEIVNGISVRNVFFGELFEIDKCPELATYYSSVR